MGIAAQPGRPRSSKLRSFASSHLAILLALACLIAAVYWRAFGIGVFSDGWVLLEIGSKGFLKAPTILLSYHTIPVTNLLSALLWKLFGLHTRAYEAANIAEFVAVCWLLYRVGVELLGDRRAAVTAAFLFAMNAGFHEVTCWPVIGNFHSLAAAFYLGGIFAAVRAAGGRRAGHWSALFGVCTLGGFFTYEPAVSVLVVGPLAAWLLHPRADGSDRRTHLRGLAPLIAWVVLCGLVVAISKLATAAAGHPAAFLPTDLTSFEEHLFYIFRALASVFSLRAGNDVLVRLMTLGLPQFQTSVQRALVPAVAWSTVGALALWRSRSRRGIFLGAWLATHLAVVGMSTMLVSRMFYLAALPAALLSGLVLWSLADHLSRALSTTAGGRRLARVVPAALAASLCLVLAGTAAADRRTAIALNLTSGQSNEHLREVFARYIAERSGKAIAPPLLLNFVSAIAENGIGSEVFVNGADSMLRLQTPLLWGPLVRRTYSAYRDGEFLNVSRLLRLPQLFALARETDALVCLWRPAKRDFEELSRPILAVPKAYTRESSPYLLWKDAQGSASVPLIRSLPLELSFATPDSPAFVAVKYWQDGTETGGLDVSGNGECLSVPAGREAGWAVAVVRGAAPTTEISLLPAADGRFAGAWSITPPAAWTPDNAPFLTWNTARTAFELSNQLVLPVESPGGGVVVEYLDDPERALTVAVNDQPIALPAPASRGGWRTVELATARNPALIRLTPVGTHAALVRNVRALPPRTGRR